MTKKQADVYEYIKKRIESGNPPSLTEVAAALNMTKATAQSVVLVLVAEGKLIKGFYKRNGLSLPEKD